MDRRDDVLGISHLDDGPGEDEVVTSRGPADEESPLDEPRPGDIGRCRKPFASEIEQGKPRNTDVAASGSTDPVGFAIELRTVTDDAEGPPPNHRPTSSGATPSGREDDHAVDSAHASKLGEAAPLAWLGTRLRHTKTIMNRLGEEIRNPSIPGWPPTWSLYGLYLLLIILATPLAWWLGQQIVLPVFRNGLLLMGDSALATYFQKLGYAAVATVPPSFPLTPTGVVAAWKFSALVFAVGSLLGMRGARIGWLTLGCITLYFLTLAAPISERAWALAFGATGWLLASTLLLGGERAARMNQAPPRRRRRMNDREARESANERIAIRHAKAAGYKSIEDYFDKRGNLAIVAIADELRIPKQFAARMRADYLEPWISVHAKSSPAQQRRMIEELVEQGRFSSDVAKKHGLTIPTARKIWDTRQKHLEASAISSSDGSSTP